jgi:glycosyltransferase involved in cell wall biosynthesis
VKIAIVTDAWAPQVNGVVRTLQAVRAELERDGHHVLVISPDQYRSMPCPSYPEIRLALATPGAVGRRIGDFEPDAIHLSTEGPLCAAARHWCVKHRIGFTTAYHTQFPDYLAKRTRLPAALFWTYIRHFHRPACAVLASTPSVRQLLEHQGIGPVRHWGRGVDLSIFEPGAPPPALFATLAYPIQLYVGRVAVEKNIEAFLASDLPGSKVVVGEGPARAALQARFPHASFLGAMNGRALAGAYAGADVFCFPSRTDTFGLVMIEALACGTPVAAYPVSGPADIVTPDVGALDDDLSMAMALALTRSRADCLAYGRSFSWAASAHQFVEALVPAHAPRRLGGFALAG